MTKKDKKLLTEGQARRWMKLANIANLSEQFVKENYEEEENVKEGAKLSQTPVKQGGNKTMAQENINEELPDDNTVPPEAPVADPTAGDHAEPDGDEAVGEPMVADLVKAIADAITAKTGVAVDVAGSAGGPGQEEPGMDEPGVEPGEGVPGEEKEMEERKGHRDHNGTHYDHDGEPMEEGKKINEEFSEAPKVTKQNQSAQGSVKDPYKSQVRVQGVEKPETMGTQHYPHKMKALEERLYKNVLSRILEAVKQAKTPQKPATKK